MRGLLYRIPILKKTTLRSVQLKHNTYLKALLSIKTDSSIYHIPPSHFFPIELDEKEIEIIDYIKRNGLAMASRERLFATILSCKYVIDNNIEGDFVECGVYKGGNSIIAAAMFKLNNSNKKVYLYDTFEGMTESTNMDVEIWDSVTAKERYNLIKNDTKLNSSPIPNKWAYCPIDDVKANFQKYEVLTDNVVFVKGDVVETLEKTTPNKISILRLDTDFYESTKKEMEVLYDKLVIGGVLIIDDYGHWAGCKKAIDDFFVKRGARPFLHYIDYTARIGIKI
jgi:hypothetical protein